MSTTTRQNNLLLNEDWTRIYQTFKNADFKSYDFENLRRVIISYLRENYPEDFNDYIESSEYMALIDAVAFLGQSLSFRVDLASRENFIELAERKESVLRIARMLSYNAKRNLPATGLLKMTSVSTTENIVDSNGRNLAQQIVSWNDPTNTNWAEQFILILNAAMADNTEFGRSQGSASVGGIPTEQYRFRSNNEDIPLFTFSKTVAGRTMAFEVVSTGLSETDEILEEAPYPGNQLGFVYRQDGRGPGSANTGFFFQFTQGSLELADFSIDVPTTNERVTVDATNINNTDLWLFKLNALGAQTTEWQQVSNLVGTNIAYNSIVASQKDIFAVETQEGDRIDLVFADGVYGNLPQGNFRLYYRVSNGLTYSISPNEMKGISIDVDYLNKRGEQHTVSIGLALQSSVTSATATESIDSIKQNAPATYYTQNRMITGEDYNLAPLGSSQDILKVKAINRTSSGISRNFDIVDASGKYSDITVFADDGYVYKDQGERSLSFTFENRTDIINFIKRNIESVFTSTDVYNFYLTKYEKIIFTEQNTVWQSVTSDINSSTGYFKNPENVGGSLLKVGVYSTNNLKYVKPEANIKFIPIEGYVFNKKNEMVLESTVPVNERKYYLWTKAVSIVGDGTNAGRGALTSGYGPVAFSDVIPSGAIANRIVPRFVNDLPTALENSMTNISFQNLNFGLRYDNVASEWKIIQASDLDLIGNFSLGKAGDTTSQNLDSSWIIAFVKEADEYLVRIRTMDYVFGSVQQNRFYFDKNERAYNSNTGKVIKDQVKVLGINLESNLSNMLVQDVVFEIDDTIKFSDGYESLDSIKIAFADTDSDGVIDDPDAFERVAGPDTDLQYLFFEETTDDYGSTVYSKIDNTNDFIKIVEKESVFNFNDTVNYPDGQLVYFYDSDEDRVKQVNRTTNTLDLKPLYRANIGRDNLKFQYVHNASEDRRIDPSVSNIIDLFLLTRSYDTQFRNYLVVGGAYPEPPSSDSLRTNFGGNLNAIKSISDEIIYHPVKYKILFGSEAEDKLQAKFKVVKNPGRVINDNDLKVRIVSAITSFFSVSNWEFGDRFYLSELSTYILNSVSPDVSNIVIVPRQPSGKFGNLFEIQSAPDEIFASGASVDDIEIVSTLSSTELGIG